MENKVVINKASSPKSLSPSVFIGDPIGDLQRSVILETATTTTHVEDSRQRHSGMTTLFNGLAFTLIELLVVVLTIGILAAVAVPQYQKAIEKVHFVKALQIVRSVAQAQKIYYLANGSYATSFKQLDDIPAELKEVDYPVIVQNFQYKLNQAGSTNNTHANVQAYSVVNGSADWSKQRIAYDLEEDTLYCYGYQDAHKFCKGFTGQKEGFQCPFTDVNYMHCYIISQN